MQSRYPLKGVSRLTTRSPELYLRRPPARNNERYRLDNMLKAAAERGVKINVIVYKEVPQALTREIPAPTRP